MPQARLISVPWFCRKMEDVDTARVRILGIRSRIRHFSTVWMKISVGLGVSSMIPMCEEAFGEQEEISHFYAFPLTA